MKGAIGHIGVSLLILTVIAVGVLCLSDDARADTTHINGTWNITEDTAIRDGSWVVNGSVMVFDDVTLRVENATLALNSPYYYTNVIHVNASARLEAGESTVLGVRYGMAIYTAGTVLLDNTTVHNMMSYSYRAGVYQVGGDLVVDHCTFDTGHYGIYAFNNVTVRSSTFLNCSNYQVFWSASSSLTTPARASLLDCELKGPGGYGVYLYGTGSDERDVTATVRGCTFDELYQGLYARYWYSHGNLLVEQNTATDCFQACYLYYVGGACTCRNNRWDGNGQDSALHVRTYGEAPPDVNNETITGGAEGLEASGYLYDFEVWDLDISDCYVGVHGSSGYVHVRHCRIYDCRYDLGAQSGYVYIYDCDHSYKAYVSHYGRVMEPAEINFTSVTWNDGSPVEEVTVHFENETGYHLADLDLEDPRPVLIPLWLFTRYVNITVEEARGGIWWDGLFFRSDPFPVRDVERMDLVIIDNSTPELEVLRPREGEKFPKSGIWVKGNWSERGAGMGTVRVSYTGSGWYGAEVVENGTWHLFLDSMPDGLHHLYVNITDNASNSMEVAVPNITIDTVWPHIDVLRPLRFVKTNPIHMVGRTEPLAQVFVDYRRVEVMPDGMFSALLTLDDGENDVHIRIVDQVGHENQTLYKVVLDTTPPALMVESPEDDGWLSQDSVRVRGTTEAEAVVDVNGYTGDMEYGRFAITVPLAEGTTQLLVRSMDRAGNVATEWRTVHVDTTPPQLSITEPVDGTSTGRDRMVLSGTVEDENLDRVLVNNLSADVVNTSWFREIGLDEGPNHILVVAWDWAGNRVEEGVTVTLDRTSPVVTASMSVDGVKYGPGEGPATTRSKAVDLEVDSNERSLLRISGGDPIAFGPGKKSRNVLLEPGTNLFVLRVEDLVGNAAGEMTFLVVHDSEPPELVLAGTEDVVYTRADQYLVSGTTGPDCQVTVGTIPTPVLANGSFALWVALEEGRNTIRVASFDPAGNEASETLQVVRETEEGGGLTVGGATAGAISGLVAGTVIALVVVFLMGRRKREEEDLYRPPPRREREPPAPGTGPPATAPALEPVRTASPPPEPPAPPGQPPQQYPQQQPHQYPQQQPHQETYRSGEDEWESL